MKLLDGLTKPPVSQVKKKLWVLIFTTRWPIAALSKSIKNNFKINTESVINKGFLQKCYVPKRMVFQNTFS